MLSFNPVVGASTDSNQFRCFWSNGRAWGVYKQTRNTADEAWTPEVEVLGGSLEGVTVSAGETSWTVTGA
jgi:hypothetical protein